MNMVFASKGAENGDGIVKTESMHTATPMTTFICRNNRRERLIVGV